MGNRGGRPTDYNPEIANIICKRVATHDVGIQRLCDMYDDMPCKTTIRLWKLTHEEFATQYANAKCKQIENLAEDIIDISDDSTKDTIYDAKGNPHCDSEWVARSRLRVDSRKWLASKLAPKIYGDRKAEETSSPTETLSKIQALVADLNKDNKSDI